jgi:Acetyltransferase (GNAT) domain
VLAENSGAAFEISCPPMDAPPVASPPAPVAAQPVNPVHQTDWDGLVVAHPNHSIFHSVAWAKTLTGAYGYTPVYFAGDESGAVRSLLPLMEVDSWLTGRRGIALPFTDDCEPLCPDPAGGRALLKRVFEFAKSRRWKSIEFRGGRELFPDAPVALAFYGHRLNLSEDIDRLFAKFESSVRRAIRKAEKSGVIVSVSRELDAVKTFYWLQCQTRRKHGLPPQPFAFFQNIWEHILSKDLGMIVIACCQDRPIAASVYFQWGGRAVYKYGASDETFQHLRGTNLVMWEAIKWLVRHGAKALHLGRTSLGNEGLRRFKLGWGAEEHKIEYVKYDFRKGAFVTETDEAMGWHNFVFRALPVSISRVIGAALYRHWA